MIIYYIDVETGKIIGVQDSKGQPNGTVRCAGGLCRIDTHQKLYEVIGDKYGKSPEEGLFRLPTYRQAEQDMRKFYSEYGAGLKVKLEKDSSSREKGRGLQDWDSNPNLLSEEGGPSCQLDDPELEEGEIPITPPQPR